MFSEEQEDFLRDHTWAVLGTGRKDGSPQLSTIGYDWDGKHILVSIKSFTAKWRNVLRQPRVSLLVHEGRKQLVIYGTAEAIDEDPDRLELSRRVFRKLSGNPDAGGEDEPFKKLLDSQQRTVLRITPEKAFINE